MTDARAPAWLRSWQAGGLAPDEAAARFLALDDVAPADLAGSWRGATLPTGHPLDGLLEGLGWWGKAVGPDGSVHPLLFRLRTGRVLPLEPALMPTALALAWPALARHRAVGAAFRAAGPMLVARRPGARLDRRDFAGRPGTALCYLRQPIVDHLRRVDDGRVIGLMERRGMAPLLFLLTRAAAPAGPVRTGCRTAG